MQREASDGSSRPTLDVVEILVSQMGLSNESKAVSTPGVRTTDEEDGKELGAEDRACYRSWTMRASYLSQDRCELQFAVKELARRMQQPNTKNMQALKRLVRFLKEARDAWSCTTDKLNSQSWTSSQTATGQGVRRPDGRLRLRT